MKSFTQFVRKYQICETQEAQDTLIKTELSRIRNYLEKSPDKYLSLGSLWKLIFMRKLGYDVNFFKHHILDLLSHKKDQIKSTGRAALDHLFEDNDELITLSTQILFTHGSLAGPSADEALLLVASIANLGYVGIFLTDIVNTINSEAANSSHYTNSLLVLIKFIKLNPGILNNQLKLDFPSISDRLTEENPVLSRHIVTLLSLTFNIIPDDQKKTVAAKVTNLLKRLVIDHVSHPYFDHHGVISPFLQTSLISFLSKFKLIELDIIRVKSIVSYIQCRCEITSDGVRSRATLAILYETLKLVSILLSQNADSSFLEDRIIDLIAKYISVRDSNLRVLGLRCFNLLLQIRDCVDRFLPYRYIIIKLIDDKDDSIKFEAAKCVYYTTHRNNFKESLKILLSVFNTESYYIKRHVMVYIGAIVEAFNNNEQNEINLFVKILKILQQEKLELQSKNPNNINLPGLEKDIKKLTGFIKDFNRYLYDKTSGFSLDSLIYLFDYIKTIKFVNYDLELEFFFALLLQKVNEVKKDPELTKDIVRVLKDIYNLPYFSPHNEFDDIGTLKYFEEDVVKIKLNVIYTMFNLYKNCMDTLGDEVPSFLEKVYIKETAVFHKEAFVEELTSNQILLLDTIANFIEIVEELSKTQIDSLEELTGMSVKEDDFFEGLSLELGELLTKSKKYAKVFKSEEFDFMTGKRNRQVTESQLANTLRHKSSVCFYYDPKSLNAQLLLDIMFMNHGTLLRKQNLEASFIVKTEFCEKYNQVIVKMAILWKHTNENIKLKLKGNRNTESTPEGLLYESNLVCTTDKKELFLDANNKSSLQLFLFKFMLYNEMPSLNINLTNQGGKSSDHILYLPLSKLHFFYIDRNMTNQEILEKWDSLHCSSSFSMETSFKFDFIVKQIERFFNICRPSGENENFIIGNGKFLNHDNDVMFKTENINTNKALKMVNIKCVSNSYKVIEVFRTGLHQLFKIKSK